MVFVNITEMQLRPQARKFEPCSAYRLRCDGENKNFQVHNNTSPVIFTFLGGGGIGVFMLLYSASAVLSSLLFMTCYPIIIYF